MGKKSSPPLLIRPEFRRVFDNLSNEDTGALIQALMSYRWDGVIPELTSRLEGVFLTLRAFADEDADKYEEKREQARDAAKARWENEKKDADVCG